MSSPSAQRSRTLRTMPYAYGFRVTLSMVALTVASVASAADPTLGARDRPSVPELAVWSTWRGAEPDKGASAWFIRRFVNPNAQFKEYAPGTLESLEGIAFDVPQGRFRRTQHQSVMQQLVVAYPTEDKIVQRLAELMHDIEINLWQPKRFRESRIIESNARALAKEFDDEFISLHCFVAWFDGIYNELRTRDTLPEIIATPAACQVREVTSTRQ
jgi:hypothetical protein